MTTLIQRELARGKPVQRPRHLLPVGKLWLTRGSGTYAYGETRQLSWARWVIAVHKLHRRRAPLLQNVMALW